MVIAESEIVLHPPVSTLQLKVVINPKTLLHTLQVKVTINPDMPLCLSLRSLQARVTVGAKARWWNVHEE